MEVTNIIGGTMMQLSGDRRSLSLMVPPKPQYNRKGVQHYMGLDLPILYQLLRGDLPCPSEKTAPTVNGAEIVLKTSTWLWKFDRSTEAEGMIPVRIRLFAKDQMITMNIEDWDRELNYAKKVSLVAGTEELKWTWRSREFQ